MSNSPPVHIQDFAQLDREISELHDRGGRMQMAYAWEPRPGQFELRYLAGAGEKEPFQTWVVTPEGRGAVSLAGRSPLLSWYEREITDLYGLEFQNHPEPKPLVLRRGMPVAPFRRSASDGTTKLVCEAYGMPDLLGPDVQRLPWGPVRADVVESAEFVFFYIGEHIIHLHTGLFFKHRGMEKRFEGQGASAATCLAERISAVGSASHALAYCQAVEAAAGCVVPDRAQMLRVLIAELERLYNHLHFLGHLADTTTLKVAAAEGLLLEERAKQLNARLCGSRFLMNVLTPGGLRRDLDPSGWLSEELESLRVDFAAYQARLMRTNSFLDRLMTTGHLGKQVAFDQGATGPIKRASGVDRDLRRDHTYAAYAALPLTIPIEVDGDALARTKIRLAEIDSSFAVAQRVLLLLEAGEVRSNCAVSPNSEGLGWAEGPRGSVFYAVHFDEDGKIARAKIKSPSFSNWRVFPFTVHETNMMDYAINEASFGLTIAGCDR